MAVNKFAGSYMYFQMVIHTPLTFFLHFRFQNLCTKGKNVKKNPELYRKTQKMYSKKLRGGI